MDRKNLTNDQAKQRWCIDLEWYQQNNRSFLALAQRCLCPKCREKSRGEISAADLLTTIRDCCSKTPDFITRESPILDSIFRLFLANRNQPLDLKELGNQLNELRGGDTYRTSPEIMSRLLKSDQFYGLRQVQTQEKP